MLLVDEIPQPDISLAPVLQTAPCMHLAMRTLTWSKTVTLSVLLLAVRPRTRLQLKQPSLQTIGPILSLPKSRFVIVLRICIMSALAFLNDYFVDSVNPNTITYPNLTVTSDHVSPRAIDLISAPGSQKCA